MLIDGALVVDVDVVPGVEAVLELGLELAGRSWARGKIVKERARIIPAIFRVLFFIGLFPLMFTVRVEGFKRSMSRSI